LVESSINIGPAQIPLLKGGTQGIAHDDRLPAEVGDGKVERFNQIESRQVGWKEHLGSDSTLQIRFRYLPCDSGSAFSNQITDQRLRRAAEVFRTVVQVRRLPVGGRFLKRTCIGADELTRQRARHEVIVEVPGPDRSVV